MFDPRSQFNPASSQGYQNWMGVSANPALQQNPAALMSLSQLQETGADNALLLDVVKSGYQLYTGFMNNADLQSVDYKAARDIFSVGGALSTAQLGDVLTALDKSQVRTSYSQVLSGGIDLWKGWSEQQSKANSRYLSLFQSLAGNPTAFQGGNSLQSLMMSQQAQQKMQSDSTMMLVVVGGVLLYLYQQDKA